MNRKLWQPLKVSFEFLDNFIVSGRSERSVECVGEEVSKSGDGFCDYRTTVYLNRNLIFSRYFWLLAFGWCVFHKCHDMTCQEAIENCFGQFHKSHNKFAVVRLSFHWIFIITKRVPNWICANTSARHSQQPTTRQSDCSFCCCCVFGNGISVTFGNIWKFEISIKFLRRSDPCSVALASAISEMLFLFFRRSSALACTDERMFSGVYYIIKFKLTIGKKWVLITFSCINYTARRPYSGSLALSISSSRTVNRKVILCEARRIGVCVRIAIARLHRCGSTWRKYF